MNQADDNFTDWGAEADPEQVTKCAYCGRFFDDSKEGHIDDNTDLAFCDAPCEMHYNQEIGLPSDYECA